MFPISFFEEFQNWYWFPEQVFQIEKILDQKIMGITRKKTRDCCETTWKLLYWNTDMDNAEWYL